MCKNYTKFVKEFEQRISELYVENDYSNLVFLCIGTNKIIGDSVGPIVGNYLKKLQNEYLQIYGTLDDTINFFNAKDVIEGIYQNLENPYLITVDAALSNSNNKGDIVLSEGYIKIGKALQKSICFYSDINIKCIVGKSYLEKEKNIKELEKVSLAEILGMAELVANGIKNVLKKSNIYV